MVAHDMQFRTVPAMPSGREISKFPGRTHDDMAANLHCSWTVHTGEAAGLNPVMIYAMLPPVGASGLRSALPVSMPAELFACLVERAYRQLLGGNVPGALQTLEHALGPGDQSGLPQAEPRTLEQPVVSISRTGYQVRRRLASADAVHTRATQRIQVRTLGSFEVLVDDANISSGRKHPRRTLALLQALIAFGGRQVSRTALTDALWPDADGDQAHNALEAALHRLRGRLRVAGAIVSRYGCLDIDLQHVWVDALAFDAATANSLHQTGTIDPGACVERAFELYRGAFLPEDGANWWAVRSRDRLRSRFVNVVAGAAAWMEASNRFGDAAQLYERAVLVEELICVFHDGLIRCLNRLGRQAEVDAALQWKQSLVLASRARA